MVFVSRLLACGKSASHVFGNSLPVKDPSLFSCFGLGRKLAKSENSFVFYYKDKQTGLYTYSHVSISDEVINALSEGSGHHNVAFTFEDKNEKGEVERFFCFVAKLTRADHVGDKATIPVSVSNNGELYGNFYHLNDTQRKQFIALYKGKIIVISESSFLKEFQPEFDNKNGLSAD